MFEVNGIKAVHAIVTDECRTNKRDMPAFHEAVDRVLVEAQSLIDWHPIGKGVKFHVILAVEMPRPDHDLDQEAQTASEPKGK